MVPSPVPPTEGGDDDPVPGLSRDLRLSDAEEIAARRLEGAAQGSLKEALAVASGANADEAGLPRAEAIGAAGESFASGPLVRLIEARTAEIGRTQPPKPPDAFSAMPMPPTIDVGISVATSVGDVAPTPEIAGDVAGAPATAAMAPLPDAAAAQSMHPLADALDAAVRLAADASVAAEALENLKRMLEHKQQLESRLADLAGTAPAPAAAAASASDAPALPPIPLPLHAMPDAGGEPAGEMLPPRRRRRAPPERRGFDVRGFMAGFALSWAFGVVLYLFMTAG